MRSPEGDKIVSLCAEVAGVRVVQIMGAGLTRSVVCARWAAMLVLHRQGWSMARIGRFMDRDHTTVLYALRNVRADIERTADEVERRYSAPVVVRDWLKVA